MGRGYFLRAHVAQAEASLIYVNFRLLHRVIFS
jgi:hypothetical protein